MTLQFKDMALVRDHFSESRERHVAAFDSAGPTLRNHLRVDHERTEDEHGRVHEHFNDNELHALLHNVERIDG